MRLIDRRSAAGVYGSALDQAVCNGVGSIRIFFLQNTQQFKIFNPVQLRLITHTGKYIIVFLIRADQPFVTGLPAIHSIRGSPPAVAPMQVSAAAHLIYIPGY